MATKRDRMKFQMEITETQVAEWLCTALEGGCSNQWVAAISGRPYAEVDGVFSLVLPVTVTEDSYGDGSGTDHVLGETAIHRGVRLLKTVPHIAASLIRDGGDAADCDAFLQLCVLGEITYG